MKVLSAERSPLAVPGRSLGWAGFIRAYALDLAVSVALMLATARIWQLFDGTARDSLLTERLQGAVSRMTPFGLWDIYLEQLRNAAMESAAQAGAATWANLLFGFRLIYDGLLAVPQTFGVVWQQAYTPGDWVTLFGFLGILVMSFVLLATSGRVTLPRLLLALLVSPLAALSLFWIAQQTALDLLDGFACYAGVAPWCLVCPVACTLYWVAFPAAEHSATVTGLQALARVRLSGRSRRGMADGVSTTPRNRR